VRNTTLVQSALLGLALGAALSLPARSSTVQAGCVTVISDSGMFSQLVNNCGKKIIFHWADFGSCIAWCAEGLAKDARSNVTPVKGGLSGYRVEPN
jgi:hypothetical protein